MIALVTFERVNAHGRVVNWVQFNVRGNNHGRIDSIVEAYRYDAQYNRSHTMYGVKDSNGWLLRERRGSFSLLPMEEAQQ